MKKNSIKEIHKLYISEIVTAFVCGSIIYMLSESTGNELDARLLLPGSILIFIILESAGYWYYRYQQLQYPEKHFSWVIPLYSFFKKATPFLFILYPMYCLYLFVTHPETLLIPMTIFGLILYFFSIGEYINYFIYPLNLNNFKTKNISELSYEILNYQEKKAHNFN
jgi:hypothetical protein